MGDISIDLICPSYDRPEKLARMVSSAVRSWPSLRIVINCQPSNRGIVHIANAEYGRLVSDALLYAPDDVEFTQSSIPNAIKAMLEHFPDLDGIVGFKQSNIPNDNGASVALVGLPFIRRFPNNQMMCPDYRSLWCDTELKEYAESVNKFHYCTSALIKHYHPFVCPDETDRTHKRQKPHKTIDCQTRVKRQALNLTWGKTFDLVNE